MPIKMVRDGDAVSNELITTKMLIPAFLSSKRIKESLERFGFKLVGKVYGGPFIVLYGMKAYEVTVQYRLNSKATEYLPYLVRNIIFDQFPGMKAYVKEFW